MKKTYVGISRDHSGSMSSISHAAMKDYNDQINALREATIREGQDTIVSVVKCGHGMAAVVHREVVNSSISALKALKGYETKAGGTPLFRSVNELIDLLERAPDANDPDVAFLVIVVTDGQDTETDRFSGINNPGIDLGRRITRLQATDKWTFTFRVPRGTAGYLRRLGIPAGNILEWDQTERGMEESSIRTQTAVNTYYFARAAGKTATKSFYQTDLGSVPKAAVKKALQDVTKQVRLFNVGPRDNRRQIKDFVEEKAGSYMPGAAFYQLTKTEPKVHDGKMIAVRDKRTGKIYSGVEARSVLGLPESGTVKVVPGNHGEFEVFIQSKSVNRNLMGGTQLLYWPNVGRPA
jgi:hypothetical protein